MTQRYLLTTQPSSHRAGSSLFSLPVSRRVLMQGGILATSSLFGLGSGMTGAFTQYLLSQPRHTLRATPPAANTLTIATQTIFTHHSRTVRTITWAPDERMLASGGDDARVFIWQRDGSLVQTLPLNAPVRAVSWSPDGQQIVTADATTVSFFQAQTGQLLAQDTGHHSTPITALGWTNTPTPLAISAALDTTAIVWNGQSHQPQTIFRQHTTAIEALAVIAETVATASHGGVTRVWNALSGQEIHGYYADSAQATRAVTFSATGSLAVGGDDHRIHLWTNGRVCTQETQDRFGLHCLDTPHSLKAHTGAVRTLAVSPDGTLLASGGDDNQLIFWSLRTLAPILIVPQQETIAALAWSPLWQISGGSTWLTDSPLADSAITILPTLLVRETRPTTNSAENVLVDANQLLASPSR